MTRVSSTSLKNGLDKRIDIVKDISKVGIEGECKLDMYVILTFPALFGITGHAGGAVSSRTQTSRTG